MVRRVLFNDVLNFALRTTGAALLVVYVLWNLFWVSHASIPPSLFRALSGLPAPTTGGTRAVQQLLAGQGAESLRCNAMTVPLCLLLVLSGSWLGRQSSTGRRLSLPQWLAWSWFLVLALAWLLKLGGDPQYW